MAFNLMIKKVEKILKKTLKLTYLNIVFVSLLIVGHYRYFNHII